MSKFEKEDRYVVFKRKDMEKYFGSSEWSNLRHLIATINAGRQKDNKPLVECVVFESDWEDYDQVWDMVRRQYNYDQLPDRGD